MQSRPVAELVDDRKLLVVIPTYNEALTLPSLVQRLEGVDAGRKLHILVVDDNSPDGTGDLVLGLAAGRPWIHLLGRERPMGLGSAYRAGFQWALDRGYPLIAEMDADLSHDPAALPDLLRAMDEGADLAIGSRYVDGGGSRGWPLGRRVLSRGGNIFARTVLSLSVRDVTTGFRIYRNEAVRLILETGTQCDGYGFQVEGVFLVARAGGRIREVPILFVDRAYGESKMTAAIAREAVKRCVGLAFTKPTVPALHPPDAAVTTLAEAEPAG